MPPARHYGLIIFFRWPRSWLRWLGKDSSGTGNLTRRPLLLSHFGYSQRDREQGRLSAVLMPPGTSAPYNFSRRDDEGDHQ
jgi:hypothetical protein